MSRPKNLRLISYSELRPGDLIAVWTGSHFDGSKENCYDYFFVISVDFVAHKSYLCAVTVLATSKTLGIRVLSERESSNSIYTSKGVLFREWDALSAECPSDAAS
jgi:hypothetical protein